MTASPATPAPTLSLRDASDLLGVHYMTAYRYVRTGRLPAIRSCGIWVIRTSDVMALQRRRDRAREQPPRRGAGPAGRRVTELAERLVAGDSAGAWTIIEAALATATDPPGVYRGLLVPALRRIGDQWEAGHLRVADEHVATATVGRLLGRMGPHFSRRGRPRGSVVIAAPEGELHGMASALAADHVRWAGYATVDLGASTPPAAVVDALMSRPGAVLVLSVTTPAAVPAMRATVRALRAAPATAATRCLVGGAGVTARDVRGVDASWAGASADDLVTALD